MQSINLFKQSQVFRCILYLHDVQKLASVPYSSLSNWKPWFYLYCHQINEKYFHKYDNHKTIEISCCKSKNLKTMHLFKVMRILWSLYTALICPTTPRNRFQHRPFDIFPNIFLTYSLVYITEPVFLPFLNASSV